MFTFTDMLGIRAFVERKSGPTILEGPDAYSRKELTKRLEGLLFGVGG